MTVTREVCWLRGFLASASGRVALVGGCRVLARGTLCVLSGAWPFVLQPPRDVLARSPGFRLRWVRWLGWLGPGLQGSLGISGLGRWRSRTSAPGGCLAGPSASALPRLRWLWVWCGPVRVPTGEPAPGRASPRTSASCGQACWLAGRLQPRSEVIWLRSVSALVRGPSGSPVRAGPGVYFSPCVGCAGRPVASGPRRAFWLRRRVSLLQGRGTLAGDAGVVYFSP